MASIIRTGFLITGIVSILFGVVLIGTAGIRGFTESGGEDTLLFQVLTYVCIPVLIGGMISIIMAIRPNRMIALIAGILIILPSIFLTLLGPTYGGPIFLMGIITVVLSRKIPKK